MYPYYRLGAQISSDDINGVQALYGPPNGSQPTAPTAPATPTPVPATPTAPVTLTIQNPSGGDVQTVAPTETLSGIVSNATGAAQVTWQTDHNNAGMATVSGTAPTSWSIASVPLVTGSNTITVTATDSNHRTSTQALEVTRTAAVTQPAPPAAPPSTPPTPGTPDVVAPTIAIASPGMSIVQTSQPTITVSGSASDNVGVVKVTWQNTLAGSGAATGTTNWSAASIPLYHGTNTLVLRAYDAAGNSSWRSLTVVRQ
jgi:hypothetical protein